ncbi:hypothetical protein CRG98_018307 [Punica granatum]|uniref:Uncharacterized protein n=1 Tax=Punica granatum TaxID=22663 RepID=A0A2I0K0U7_PUNGR|nr:hypothetical protein CRG98_018307 [Punica granatum]
MPWVVGVGLWMNAVYSSIVGANSVPWKSNTACWGSQNLAAVLRKIQSTRVSVRPLGVQGARSCTVPWSKLACRPVSSKLPYGCPLPISSSRVTRPSRRFPNSFPRTSRLGLDRSRRARLDPRGPWELTTTLEGMWPRAPLDHTGSLVGEQEVRVSNRSNRSIVAKRGVSLNIRGLGSRKEPTINGPLNCNAKIVNRFLDAQAYSPSGFLARIDQFIDFTVSKRANQV